jgi:hypothetical protein
MLNFYKINRDLRLAKNKKMFSVKVSWTKFWASKKFSFAPSFPKNQEISSISTFVSKIGLDNTDLIER